MAFDELWEVIWKDTTLPKEAKKLLPQNLFEKTKRQIMDSGKTTTEIAKIIIEAVNVINHGSVVTIDELFNESLIGE